MSALPVGTILKGRYQIFNVVFQSRLSNVYFVNDLHLKNRIWVIKELLILTAHPVEKASMVSYFQSKLPELVKLEHPNYAKIIDFFTEGDRLYLVREYSPGIDIRTFIETLEAPLPEPRLLDIGYQVADVLEYLSNKDFSPSFYQDFVPQSIILTMEGNVKLIDLGLSRFSMVKRLSSRKSLSPDIYFPPEVFLQEKRLNPQAFVYMVGALMYHLATLNEPDPFNMLAVEINSGLSPKALWLLKKAIKIAPNERHKNLNKLKQEISMLIKAKGR